MSVLKASDAKCFSCKWQVQGEGCSHCAHPNRVIYQDIKEPCSYCGRQPNTGDKGCGGCMGRGQYVYPGAYDECDCGGFEAGKFTVKEFKERGWEYVMGENGWMCYVESKTIQTPEEIK